MALLAPSCDLSAQATTPRAGDDLLGLWGGEPVFGPQVRGEILLARSGRRWTARASGFEAMADQVGDSVVITLAGGQGTLKAWVGGTNVPLGFWIQPAAFDNPSYATPVHFRPASTGTWLGTVTPLDHRFPLYLSVSRDGTGALRGVFRNPVANWPGRGGWYRIERDGDNVAVINQRTGRVQWRQAYDSAQRTITFDFGGPFTLGPRSLEQAVGFVPRSPSLPLYDYRRPVMRSDGWQTANASLVRVDTLGLRSIVRNIISTDPLDESAPRIHSLLVARHGRLVLDEYFLGYGPDQVHDLRSASKTITSIMAGVAMRLTRSFEMATTVGSTPMTVGQLLTHTSGLACDDDDDASPGNEDRMQSEQAGSDWYQFFMVLPRVHPPGTTYAYCSAGINMVGRVIGTAAGSWLPAFFDRRLAQPLQISNYAMNLMPNAEAYAGGGLHMTPRDFLKFGQLYLAGGVWQGVRVVDAAWVTQSTSHQVDRPDSSDDGFGWHRHRLTVGSRTFQTYEASGNGGQFLVVIPDLDLSVVVTAGNYGQYNVWRKIREELIPLVMAAAR